MSSNGLATVNHIVDPSKGEHPRIAFCEHGEVGNLRFHIWGDRAIPFSIYAVAISAAKDVLLFADVRSLRVAISGSNDQAHTK
jgi:hypothetical protein